MKKILIGVAVLAVAPARAAFMYRDRIGMMIAFSRLKPEVSFAEAAPPAAPDYSLTAELGGAAGSRGRSRTSCRTATCRIARRPRKSTSSSCTRPRSSARRAGTSRSTTPRPISSPTCSSCAARRRCSTAAARSTRRAIGRRRSISFMDRLGQRHAGAAARVRGRANARSTTSSSTTTRDGRSSSRRTARARCTCARCSRSASPARRCASGSSPLTRSASASIAKRWRRPCPTCRCATRPSRSAALVTWNAVGPQAQPWGDPRKNICVNPLTWRADGAAAEASLNLGAVAYPGTFEGTLADVKGVPQDFVDAKPVVEIGRRRRAMRRRHAAGEGDPLAELHRAADGPRQLSHLRLQPVPHESAEERGGEGGAVSGGRSGFSPTAGVRPKQTLVHNRLSVSR